MMVRLLAISCLSFLFLSTGVLAQKKDSISSGIKKNKNSDLTEKAFKSIVRKPEADTVFNFKSEEAFIPYEGKIIRHIIIEPLRFYKTVLDTSKITRSKFIQFGESLHTDTREQTLKNNLFIKEGKPLNPYRLADNERYLRDINFIKDARIFVVPLGDNSDSVDLLVMTRDVFSLGASLDPSSPSAVNWLLQEGNFLGTGLRFAYTGLYDSDRRPEFGSAYLIHQNSIRGSFINGTIGYTNINTARSMGNENEAAVYIRLDRPLFMPYARWAGGVEWSTNWSNNVFVKPDTLFARYAYSIQDYWGGITFGEIGLSNEKKENRNRRFLSARVLDQHFIKNPDIALSPRNNLLYSNRTLALTQFTLFRQDYYKTKYIYGFGRTEDVPYGYSISFTAGWEKQFGLERPYSGTEIRKTFTNNGNIISFDTQLGGYFRNKEVEDMSLQFTANYFTKLYDFTTYKVRNSVEVSLGKFIRRSIKNPLDINNENGIQGFRTDSLTGDSRLRARFQALVFTNWKLIGFNFAVVPQFDFAVLAQRNETLFNGRFFQGYSLGLRTRNENLIFNTIEVRGYLFPSTVENIGHFRINVSANLRIKYPTELIRAPDTIFN
ncbi:hypothetical protein MASR2M41_10560 [Flammeovirgaceae bacterium]